MDNVLQEDYLPSNVFFEDPSTKVQLIGPKLADNLLHREHHRSNSGKIEPKFYLGSNALSKYQDY